MNAPLTLPAPAKLNRMLHIVGRRDDGYHLLQTLFQFIDLCDQLTLTPRSDGEIHLISEVSGVSTMTIWSCAQHGYCKPIAAHH